MAFYKGTSIHLWVGCDIPVENLETQHSLFGDDGEPRVVLSINSGKENMYHFYFWSGETFIFNESHILCLLDNKQNVHEFTVSKFLLLDASERSLYVAYRPYNYALYLKRPDIDPIIRIEKVGFDTYYGFTLDGNRRFLSSSGIVLCT